MKQTIINKAIVQEYYQKWQAADESLFDLLAENLCHISPHATFTSKQAFLTACWENLKGFPVPIKEIIAEEDTVCIWYEMPVGQDPNKKVSISEWIKLENGLIKSIRVFY